LTGQPFYIANRAGDNYSAGHEIPHLHETLRFNTVFTKNLPLGTILSHVNQLHKYIPHFSDTHFNIILPHTVSQGVQSV